MIHRLYYRLRLVLGIAWRRNQAEYRTSLSLAWKIACIVYPSTRIARIEQA